MRNVKGTSSRGKAKATATGAKITKEKLIEG